MRMPLHQTVILCMIAALLAVGATITRPLSAIAQDQHKGHAHDTAREPIKDVDPAEIATPGPLAEIVLGQANAPVTIIEYASITCGHCGRFHRDLLPTLKSKYIDSGIARLIFREFPLERVAAATALLARCTAPERTYDMIKVLFERQQIWLASGDVRAALGTIAAEFGINDAAFDACLTNEALFKQIAEVRRRAQSDYGVTSTPTFFINGKPLVGPKSIEEFDSIIEPLVKN